MTTTGIELSDFTCGDFIEVDHTITGLLNPITNASMGFKAWEGDTALQGSTIDITTTPSPSGQIVNAGTIQTDGTYTAEVIFIIPGTETRTRFKPGKPTYYFVRVLPGPFTSEVSVIKPKVGGLYG